MDAETSGAVGARCALGPTLWARREPDGSFRVGLTDAAARRAGTIAHYRGPVAGRRYAAREPAASIESEKWVGHLALPIAATIVEVNPLPLSDPRSIGADPEGTGWLWRLRPVDPAALDALFASPTGATR